MNEPKYTMGLNPKGETEQFPQVWMNRRTGQILNVVPWWDMLAEDTWIEGRTSMLGPEGNSEQRFKIGTLAQVGWLVQNESGMWFGVGLNLVSEFEKVGDL